MIVKVFGRFLGTSEVLEACKLSLRNPELRAGAARSAD